MEKVNNYYLVILWKFIDGRGYIPFLLKMDSKGNILWKKNIDGPFGFWDMEILN